MTQDLLLFRRMRGMFWGGLAFGIVGIVTAIMLPVTLFANEAEVGSADLVFEAGIGILMFPAIFVAVLMGATAGSVDYQHGVLRDLVLTGRRRVAVPLRRLAAAATWQFIFAAIAVGVVTLVAVTLAPVGGGLDVEEALRLVASLVPLFVAALAFGAGVALLVGSRGPAIGIFFLFTLVIDTVLLVLPKVGEWWEHVSFAIAFFQTSEWVGGTTSEQYANSNVVGALVLAAWTLVPLALGLVRYQRRDL
ncbi:MAG: hypothetical protein JWO69_408 [Thermoleophilia bacterium]|nr:hypothetical protein [Thermoleophilia bacterium]